MIHPGEPWSLPLFRWAGSKRKLVPELLHRAPSTFRTYFEPFVGSGCLFFALRPPRAVLGDINVELIEVLQVLREHPRKLYRAATAFNLTEKSYYDLRDRSYGKNPLARAARFLALNRACFNGLYRTNRAGKFNVPYGRKTGTVPAENLFYRASVALRGATIMSGDFEKTVARARSGDFVYLDPPYVYTDRKDRGEYGVGSFSIDDIARLGACLDSLAARGVFFLLSYLDSPDILSLTSRWNVTRIPVRRQISGFSEFRRSVDEVMISNYRLGEEWRT